MVLSLARAASAKHVSCEIAPKSFQSHCALRAPTTCLKRLLSPAAADSPAKPDPMTTASSSAADLKAKQGATRRARFVQAKPWRGVVITFGGT